MLMWSLVASQEVSLKFNDITVHQLNKALYIHIAVPSSESSLSQDPVYRKVPSYFNF